jgi:DNA-binding SARP family transcriptional activator
VAVVVVEAESAPASPRFDIRILGPVDVARDGLTLDLGGPQPRAVIAHLALAQGRVVPVERLVTRLWGEQPPAAPLASLQTTLSRLRRLLEPDRPAGVAPTVIASEAPGYVLNVPRDHVDLHRFRDLALDGRRAAAAGHPAQALDRFAAALAEWRGPALAGLGPEDVVAPIAVALDEERLSVLEERFDAMLALGQHAEAVAELSVAVAEHPLRERLWSTLAIAFYRSQRQADALRAIDQARRTLIDELGLDPGPELRELERRILDHDPALLAVPVAVAPVIERIVQPRSSDARFVGRRAEWARLLTDLDLAGGGQPRLVLLEGEPGIGKSAIAERLLDHARNDGWRVAVGRCVDGELAPALWPIVELAREIAGDASVLESAPSDGASRTLVEIADGVLAALDRDGPDARWCLFVDDLHWADRLTLEVLVLLCERLRDRRVLVMGALRPVTTVPAAPLHSMIGNLTRVHGSDRIGLPPLGEQDVAEILRRSAGSEPPPEAVRMVHRRAGGNPFFVGELALLYGEGGVTAELGVPDAVRDVVRARLHPLPPITKTVLQVAAVAGERLHLAVVIRANGLDEEACLEALDPAVVSRVLVPGTDHDLRFAHALVRDAVLADIAPMQLARLHRSVADAIEAVRGTGVDVVETIARHRLAALPLGDVRRTVDQLVEAAEVARWRGAFDIADDLAEQAIELVKQLPRDLAVDTLELRALEGITVSRGRRLGGPAGAALADRIESLGRRTDSDAARVLAIYVRWWDIDVDDVPPFRELADQAMGIASRSENPYARMLGYHIAGFQAFQEGRVGDASELLELGVAASGVSHPGDDPGFVPTIHLPAIAGIVAQLRGDDDVADSHVFDRYGAWQRVRGIVDDTATIDVGFTIGCVMAMRGDVAGTRRAVQGVDVSDPPVWSRHLGFGLGVLEGWSAALLGDADGAERALEWLERLDDVNTVVARSCVRTFAGAALLHVDDRRALDVLERARAEAVARGEVWWLAETLRLLAEAEQRFGDPTHSRALLAEARRLAERQGAQLLVDRLSAVNEV